VYICDEINGFQRNTKPLQAYTHCTLAHPELFWYGVPLRARKIEQETDNGGKVGVSLRVAIRSVV